MIRVAVAGLGYFSQFHLAAWAAWSVAAWQVAVDAGVADADAYLGAGADVVMSATGAMWDPYLAAKWRAAHGVAAAAPA